MDEHLVGRVPPHSLAAEQAVLASILISSSARNDVVELLVPEDFYRLRHQVIYRVVLDLADQSDAVDLVTLSESLNSSGRLEEVGGVEYLSELFQFTPTAANAAHYARIVRERSILRQISEAGTEMARNALDSESNAEEILDDAERRIFGLSQRAGERPYYPMRELVQSSFEHIEKLFEHQELVTGVPSGFRDLDNVLAGFQASDLIILAARPSMGKTAFCLNITVNAARSKVPVLFFSLEMSRLQLVLRMLCSEARVEGNKLRRGYLSEKDWPNLTTAAGMLQESPIFIDDTPGISIREMRSKARRLAAEQSLGLVIVDYLQLMESKDKVESRNQEISQISRGLKGLARELKVPVIALSQLSRAVESRTDKRPMLSDLRESGAIEQDADVVVFLYRDEYYNRDKSSEPGVAEVIVGKQRNGPTGTIKLKFFDQYTRFADLTFQRE